MIFARIIVAACILIASGASHATVSTLAADGTWNEFFVSEDLSGGKGWIDVDDSTPLSFTFTVPTGYVGALTVVDTGYAGDTFNVYNGANLLGPTSSVSVGVYPGIPGIVDADVAFADPSFSKATFTLVAGNYSINGVLDQSVLDAPGGLPLNSTIGDVRLTVSAVPEPESVALMLVGFGLIAVALRRRLI
jgi:hypothetical protein